MAIITKDTSVGFELQGVKKQMVIQLMGSRFWGRTNPLHWDPVYSAQKGLKAPVATGEMSSGYIAEMLVHHFGKDLFENGRLQCKYVKSIYAGETIITHGIVREKTPKGDGFRFKVEVWADNQDGELKTAGWAEADVGTK